MNISNIEVIKVYDKGMLKMLLSATIDNCLIISGIKVIQGRTKRFVLLPCRKNKRGVHEEIIRFANESDRRLFEETIHEAYNKYMELDDALRGKYYDKSIKHIFYEQIINLLTILHNQLQILLKNKALRKMSSIN